MRPTPWAAEESDVIHCASVLARTLFVRLSPHCPLVHTNPKRKRGGYAGLPRWRFGLVYDALSHGFGDRRVMRVSDVPTKITERFQLLDQSPSHRSGRLAAAAGVLDRHGEGDPWMVSRRIAGEPGVV